MFKLPIKKTFAAMDDATCLIVIVGSHQDDFRIHGAPDRFENQSQPLFAEQLAALGIKTVVINFDAAFPKSSLDDDPGFEVRPNLWIANYALNVNWRSEFPTNRAQEITANLKRYEDLHSNRLLPLPILMLNRINEFLNEDAHKRLIMIDHSMAGAPLCRHLYCYIEKQQQTSVVSAYWSGLPAIILDHDTAKRTDSFTRDTDMNEHVTRLYNENLTPDEIKKCYGLALVADNPVNIKPWYAFWETINERYLYVRQEPEVRECIIRSRAENTPENWVICSSVSDIMPSHLRFDLASGTRLGLS